MNAEISESISRMNAEISETMKARMNAEISETIAYERCDLGNYKDER